MRPVPLEAWVGHRRVTTDNFKENEMANQYDQTLAPKMDIPTTRTWSATMGLRIVKPIPDFGFLSSMNEDKLQQAWRCHETGDVEWRDVEVVRIPRE